MLYRAALEDRIEQMARDYRLDPAIRMGCRSDIRRLCPGDQEASAKPELDAKGSVMECLKGERERLKSRACRDAVDRSIERSARNFRYAPGIAAACMDDRKKLCQSLQPVRPRLHAAASFRMRTAISPGCFLHK